MSTLRPHPRLGLRLRLLRTALPFGLALAVLGTAGCSSTRGLRTAGTGTGKTKTFLAVGDKPMPVVTGEPGSSVEADEPDPTPRAQARARAGSDGRISGRVFDADGRPVPEARVRLAVGGTTGGRDLTAVTDRSGAFTLRGVRPGTTYNVVAEWEGDDGRLTGRAVARTSDTDVRITLAAPGATAAKANARVNRVSDREALDDEADAPGGIRPDTGKGIDPGPDDQARAEPPVNEEDLPPAPEADAVASGADAPQRGAAPARRTASEARWRRGDTGAAPRTVDADPDDPDAGPEPSPARRSVPAADAEAGVDDGPNPLPPALEPGKDPEAALGGAVERPAKLAAAGRLGVAESPSRPTVPPADEPSPDRLPGAEVVVPETFSPVALGHDPKETRPAPAAAPRRTASRAADLDGADANPLPAAFENPFDEPAPAPAPAAAVASTLAPAPSELPEPAPAPTTTTTADPEAAPVTAATAVPFTPPPAAVAKPAAAVAAAATAAAASKKRPTWGEVLASEKELPPLEAELAAPRPAQAVAHRDPETRSAAAAAHVADANPAKAAGSKADATSPLCDYDARHRKINDFRLPDLAGKPVRFQDIDADLILLDFWGTWCQPCLRAVPHLVDLQNRVGGKRLAVVGIACEQDSPDRAAPRVASTAEKLKVNYRLLLSRNDGTCPLQEALQIQAFPTMVLLDRQGRVLWRDQGATPSTLARLDNMIATATGGGETARR